MPLGFGRKGDWQIVGSFLEMSRNFHRVYDWKMEAFVEMNTLTMARPFGCRLEQCSLAILRL